MVPDQHVVHTIDPAYIVSKDRLLDYFEFREHRGPLTDATASVSHRHPACGDVVDLAVCVEAGLLQTLRFEARGCMVSQAAAAMLCEALEGQPVDRLTTFTAHDMLALVGLPLSPRRIACALLPLEAARLLAAKLLRTATTTTPPTADEPPPTTLADTPPT